MSIMISEKLSELLLGWARDIRDVLAERLRSSGRESLDQATVDSVKFFFESLRSTKLSVELFRKTRIHYALLEVAYENKLWPADIREAANAIVKGWEEQFGVLDRMTDNIWAKGGRMHGIYKLVDIRAEASLTDGRKEPRAVDKVQDVEAWKTVLSEKWEMMDCSIWIIEGAMRERHALRTGHLEFSVGE